MDDFLFIGEARSEVCLLALNKFIQLCEEFGIPLALEKTVFPSVNIEFLGICIDSGLMEFSLPMDKIEKIKALLHKLLSSK